jgi:chromosome segregation ATPase
VQRVPSEPERTREWPRSGGGRRCRDPAPVTSAVPRTMTLDDAIETVRGFLRGRGEPVSSDALDRIQAEVAAHEERMAFATEKWRSAQAEVERLQNNAEIRERVVEKLLAERNEALAEVERLRARADGTCSKHDDRCHDQAIANFEAWQGEIREVERLRQNETWERESRVAAEAEVERLRDEAEYQKKMRKEQLHLRDRAEAEVERLREELRRQVNVMRVALDEANAEVERLRAALNRAGDRLAQVQPGVTEPWAFDIVPKAEQEIAEALAEEKE